MASEYPRQIFCEWGNNTNVSAEFALTPASEEKGTPPLQMHEGSLSRFPITILDNSGPQVKFVSANIPWNEISAIREKTVRAGIMMDFKRFRNNMGQNDEAAQAHTISAQAYEVSATQGGLASTVQLTIGDFKGLTPVQVLSADSGNLNKLMSNRNFLAKNADRYAGNARQIQAIDEAVALLGAGALKAQPLAQQPLAADNSYVVYERHYKNKKPYNGDLRTVYGIRIECLFGNTRYPWKITIGNCMTCGRINAKGVWIPVMERAEGRTVLSVNLSEDGWIECADIMYRRLCQFEAGQFEKQLKLMEDLAWQPKTVEAQQGSARIGATMDGGLGIGVA